MTRTPINNNNNNSNNSNNSNTPTPNISTNNDFVLDVPSLPYISKRMRSHFQSQPNKRQKLLEEEKKETEDNSQEDEWEWNELDDENSSYHEELEITIDETFEANPRGSWKQRNQDEQQEQQEQQEQRQVIQTPLLLKEHNNPWAEIDQKKKQHEKDERISNYDPSLPQNMPLPFSFPKDPSNNNPNQGNRDKETATNKAEGLELVAGYSSD